MQESSGWPTGSRSDNCADSTIEGGDYRIVDHVIFRYQ